MVENGNAISRIDGAPVHVAGRTQRVGLTRTENSSRSVLMRNVLLMVFAASCFLEGIFWEIVSWACFLPLLRGCKKRTIQRAGIKVWRWLCGYVGIFSILFVVQVLTGALNTADILRLFGITKCICAPALFYFAFYEDANRLSVFRKVLLLISGLNICYLIAHFQGIISLPFLGSENVILGINVVLFPVVFHVVRSHGLTPLRLSKTSFCCYAMLFTGLLNLALFRAWTAIGVFMGQVAFFVLMGVNHSRKHKKLLMWLVSVGLAGIIVLVLLIANSSIQLDPMSIGTRVGIWRQAIVQYTRHTTYQKWIGTGNDIVAMWTKSLEAHSVVVEILLIYGIIGLGVFVASVVWVFRRLQKKKIANLPLIALTIFSYLLFCMIHPFFTGVYPFQWIVMMGVLHLLSISRPIAISR